MLHSVSQKKSKTLDDIDDILIVRKITEKEPTSLSTKDVLGEETSYRLDLDREQHLLAEEQEIIVRKRIQLLQADERGKQALISEINAIKQRQEKRAELLRHRQHALDVEKERAKRIAMLPPPLPKSVKLLLKKNDEPEPDKPDVQMPDELKTFHLKGAQRHVENKENILDPEELEAKQKMQDEWQMKAKKRFNDALKKDRMREEYSKVMKEIQNAELHNRRKIAKSISSEKKSIPCPLSDKFQTVQNQSDMEGATEKIFKKMSRKEHVIEDIEGYQDHYEEKYKKIDSDFESKMIDCVPDFVKENYEYLLEDDSKFQGGKNFSGLDDSLDVFNEAYIESPPEPDSFSGRKKLDAAINHLDKLRSDIQTEYNQTLKPLLEAAISKQDVPRKEMSDKAVAAEIIKLPGEDKAVETEMPYKVEISSPPFFPSTNFNSGGVMAFKRRYNRPILGSYNKVHVPVMRRRDVHYSVPFTTQSEQSTPTSWSTSSYCSLPSQHGFQNFPTTAESVNCDICTAEMEKDIVPQALPQDTDPSSEKKSDKSISSDKTKLSEYVQKLAKKYLAQKCAAVETVKEDCIKSVKSDSHLPVYSNTQNVNSAFEKEVIPKIKEGFVKQVMAEEPFVTTRKKSSIISGKDDEISVLDSSETLVKRHDILRRPKEDMHVNIYDKIKSVDLSPKNQVEISEYDMEANRIKVIQQVMCRTMPRFTLDISPQVKKTDDSLKIAEDKPQLDSLCVPVQCQMNAKPHIYHELSTIQEMDSALIADSFHASQSKLSDVADLSKVNEMAPKEISKENVELPGERLKMASLLDPPDTSVTELAKSIHFVGETCEEEIQPLETPQTISSTYLDVACLSSKTGSLMPSSITSSSDLNSLSSVSSSGKVISSSLVGNAEHPYLKGSKLLPHFSDVSDIHRKVLSFENYGASPSLPSSEFLSSFLNSPLSGSIQSTPSVISTNSKGNKGAVYSLVSGYNSPVFATNQSVFQEMDKKSKREKVTLLSGKNNSLIPRSVHSAPAMSDSKSVEKKDNKPSLKSGYISNLENSDTNDPRNFKPMTPHSDISSPSFMSTDAKLQSNIRKRKDFVPSEHHTQYQQQAMPSSSSETNGSFRPLTPHSYISSPSERANFTPDHNAYSSSAESFKALTPMSMVSSLSSPGDNTEFKHKNASSGSSDFYPMKVRIDISTDSVSSGSKNCQSNAVEKLSQLNYHFTLKAPVSETITGLESVNVSRQKAIITTSNSASNERKIYHLTESLDNLHILEKNSTDPKAKSKAKVCSSDFFTPQLCETDFSSLEIINKCHLKEDSLKKDIDEGCSKSKLIPDTKQIAVSTVAEGSPYTERNLLKMKKTGAESVISSKEVVAKNSENKDANGKFKESNKKENLHDVEVARGFFKQYTSLQAISSASSSTENLSEISGSKVLHQSTPIKSVDEIAQEPGIMEEPDLTLVTTDYSCKIDFRENPRELSNVSAEQCFNEERDYTIISSQNECQTPPNQNSQLLGSVDTPSMRSFLHHEISCLQTDVTSNSTVENSKWTPDALEKETNSKEKQQTQFPKSVYKQRTQRLWSNLEEVKKKNLDDERKKLMVENRLKAKEYAKKLTPKRK